jgi:hypothetical protein
MRTPWGPSQRQCKMVPGIYLVETAGHGGILIEPYAQRLLSKAAREHGWDWGPCLAFEEDCDWAMVAYELPEVYARAWERFGGKRQTAEEIKVVALECLQRWNTEYLREREEEIHE